MGTEKYGEWAFLLGVVISLVVGVFSTQLAANAGLVFGVLAVLGLVVGLLNITEKEVNSFLIASIALLASSTALGALAVFFSTIGIPQIGNWIGGFVGALSVFVAPAALIIALKAIYSLASK